MKLKEIKGDLFENDRECYCQCISADFKIVDDKTKAKDQLVKTYGDYKKWFKRDGAGAIVTHDPLVINLVTKLNYYDKPTYQTMDIALKQAADMCYGLDIFELSMPKIGCGFDGLKWEKVKRLIEKNFDDLDILISVYYL
jgi:O-acetyl-ADP-ribose deacetylase (regulator of RNase III)